MTSSPISLGRCVVPSASTLRMRLPSYSDCSETLPYSLTCCWCAASKRCVLLCIVGLGNADEMELVPMGGGVGVERQPSGFPVVLLAAARRDQGLDCRCASIGSQARASGNCCGTSCQRCWPRRCRLIEVHSSLPMRFARVSCISALTTCVWCVRAPVAFWSGSLLS